MDTTLGMAPMTEALAASRRHNRWRGSFGTRVALSSGAAVLIFFSLVAVGTSQVTARLMVRDAEQSLLRDAELASDMVAVV